MPFDTRWRTSETFRLYARFSDDDMHFQVSIEYG